MLGERHDGPEQERTQEQVIAHLIKSNLLQALVIEMVDHPHSTRGLAPNATEAQVRTALHWAEAAWPWARYRHPIMTAVRAGVLVSGGNLPRSEMAQAMGRETPVERHHPAAWAHLQTRIRESHCGLLPEAQIPRMSRIQVAKDERMAQTVLHALGAGQTGQVVVLIAGAVHANKQLGVPLHLPKALVLRAIRLMAAGDEASEADAFDAVWITPSAPATDHCAQLRQQWSPQKHKRQPQYD